MDRYQAVVDGVVVFMIIWGLGSFVKTAILAFEWVTCNPSWR